MEKIDVLLATYNGEKYIAKQLESILNQTYKNIRVIISDDCSTDNTLKLLKEYETKDSRIIVYEQSSNLGYVKNFEFLLEKVEANYYMLSDQDDVWLEDKIQKSYDKLINDNVDLVFGDLKIVDENLNVINDSMFKFLKIDKRLKKYNDYRLLYMDNCVTGCTIISKSSFLSIILPLPKTTKYLIHDYWIALVVMLNGKVSYMEEKYILYRQHGNNQVGTDKVSTKFKKFDMVRELFVNVKKERFQAFCENEKVFPDELKNLNKKALEYYRYIENIKWISLKKINIFHKLYKYQDIKLYILNFVILHIPILARGLFNIRYIFLKLIGKR